MSSFVNLPKPSQIKPPDKGSFPLDHYGECKAEMLDYMRCLKANNSDQSQCKHLSKLYFKCRMDKHLMVREDFEQLGFHQLQEEEVATAQKKN